MTREKPRIKKRNGWWCVYFPHPTLQRNTWSRSIGWADLDKTFETAKWLWETQDV